MPTIEYSQNSNKLIFKTPHSPDFDRDIQPDLVFATKLRRRYLQLLKEKPHLYNKKKNNRKLKHACREKQTYNEIMGKLEKEFPFRGDCRSCYNAVLFGGYCSEDGEVYPPLRWE